MTISSNFWTALQERVDFIVDGRFSEPVILIPWVKGEGVYLPGEQGPDPTRKIRTTVGVYVTPGSKLIGESGRATGGSGGGFATQLLEQECWLSITVANLGGDVTYWQESDRVYFPDRDQFYNISYVETSATYRPNVHLIVDHGMTTGEGNPVGQLNPSQANSLYFDIDAQRFYRSTGTTNNDWVTV